MYKKYRKIASWFIILFVGLLVISCQQGKSSNTKKDKIDRTIENALYWVYGHPAHFADGGFIEIAEEVIAFYILSNNTDDPSERNIYIREIQKRLDLIESKGDFKPQPPEYTMFLTIASICEKLALKTIDFRKIIEDQILTNPMLYPPHITTTIWNTVYLERMGYSPPNALKDIIPHSTLSKEVQQQLLLRSVRAQFDPMLIDRIAITAYDITHEIFSLTDFGELPPPPIIIDNQRFFAELFDGAIKWAMTAKHIDILAEIIMCVKILDLKNVPSFEEGIEFIIKSQKGDGTFGITNPGRPNVYRHGILVSIIALSMH